MTVDYNQTLLDYITGNLTVQSMGVNQFRGNEQKTNNIIQELNDAGVPADYNMRTLTSDTTSNYLMYGTYTQNSVDYGFIVVLDQSGTILKIITTYTSGTKLAPFQALNYDSNGNIYGVDYYNSKYRVVLLNNVAVEGQNGYTCRLRNSYYISDNTFLPPNSYLPGTSLIKKDPANDNTYYIMGQKASGSNKVLYLCKFTINVGSTNEWDYYTGSTVQNTGSLLACDFLLQQSGSDTVADIYYYGTNTQTTLSHEYFNGSAMVGKTDVAITTQILDLRVLDNDTIFVSSRVNNGGTYTMYLYQVEGVSLSVISADTLSITLPSYYLNIINGKLFTKIAGYTGGINEYFIICGVYDGENYIKSPTYTMTLANYINTTCAVQTTYSLYKFIVQGAIDLYRPYIVIYDNQYSGSSYTSYNTLTPLHSEIYSNSSLVFARGLYNKQVYQNMCVSTVNIPNNYLNGINLMPSKLLGTTMTELVNNTDTITKNVYENLFINFNNKIQVLDEDTSELYPETANYINTSVSYGTQQNYEGQMITKMRINYVNRPAKIVPIHWTNNGGVMEYTYGIYLGFTEQISSIDFLNEQENFVYISKQYNFQPITFYRITQKIRID